MNYMSTSQVKRRKKPASTKEYIKVRVSQLTEDKLKAHDPRDIIWYERLIEELQYVQMVDEQKYDNGLIVIPKDLK